MTPGQRLADRLSQGTAPMQSINQLLASGGLPALPPSGDPVLDALYNAPWVPAVAPDGTAVYMPRSLSRPAPAIHPEDEL